MRHNFTHPTVNESQDFWWWLVPQQVRQNVSASKSPDWSKWLVFWSLEEMKGSMPAQGILPHLTRPKLLAIEASKALFGVTFVYTRSSASSLRVRFARGLLTQFCRLSRFLSIVCCPLPLIMAQHSVWHGNRAAARRNRLKIDLCGSRFDVDRNPRDFGRTFTRTWGN